jgi:hypothetical protein
MNHETLPGADPWSTGELAERVGRLEPVDVAVAAQLSQLLSDPSSPAFVGGSDAGELADLTSRCLDRVEGDA